MKKTLIITNVVTFVLLVLVFVYSQWQGNNARMAFEESQSEVAEYKAMSVAAKAEAERAMNDLLECRANANSASSEE